MTATEQQQDDDETVEQVLIFYSSKTEPQLLPMYRDSIDYLKQSDTALDVIDVEEDKETAREHDVVATPLVIVERTDSTHRYLGVVDGLKSVLEDDLYGQSILHQMGFKEGRKFARDHDLADADSDTIEQALHDRFAEKGATAVTITAFDPDEATATCEVTPDDSTSDPNWHAKLEEFLGGCFTEIFDTGVMGVETTCSSDGHDSCVFTIQKQG